MASLRPAPKDPRANAAYRRAILARAADDDAFREEVWIRASRDIIWFTDTFAWTYSPKDYPDAPNRPFILYDGYQEDAVLKLDGSIGVNDVLIEKSRDMGASWLNLLVFYHRWHFKPRQSFLIGSRKEEYVDKTGDPKTLFWKLDFLYNNLPGWLQPNRRRNDLHMENLDNGSTIDGESTNSDFATGDRRTAVLLDEFAKVHENGHSILRATRDVTKCRIFNSTPEGAAGAFYDTKLKLEATHPGRILRLHWSLHPEKAAGLYSTTTRQEGGQIEVIDKTYPFPTGYNFIADGKLRSPWYDNECDRAASQQEIAQELDIDYAASGWQYFDQPKLDKVAAKYVRNPIMRGELIFDNTSRSRRKPELLESAGGRLMLWMVLDENYRVPVVPGDEFVIGADTSMGKGGDMSSNSVASVGNRRTGEKVAQFTTNQMSPQDFCIYTIALCHFFHNAYLIWEDNGPGGEFTKQVIETGYRNVFYRVNDEKSYVPDRTKRMGWWSDKTTKRILLSDYFKALIGGTFINRCAEALKECGEYVHGANGEIYHARSKSSIDPTASGENHGDMVIADALVNRGFVDVAVVEDQDEPEPSPHSFLGRRLEAERLRQRASQY